MTRLRRPSPGYRNPNYPPFSEPLESRKLLSSSIAPVIATQDSSVNWFGLHSSASSSVSAVATSIEISADQSTVMAGTAVTLTATVIPLSASANSDLPLPIGNVDFYDDSVLLGSTAISNGTNQAVLATSDLAVGVHAIGAVYVGNSAFLTSGSSPIPVTVLPSSTSGADLTGSIVSTNFPTIAAPGESTSVSVRITNQGTAPAVGILSNALYFSLDTTLDLSDHPIVVRGPLAHTAIHLQPNASVVLRGTLTVPASIPVANYYLLATINANSSLDESVYTNNVVSSASPVTISDSFGNVGGRVGVVLKLPINNGTFASFHLNGPGTGILTIGDDGTDLELSGTTMASSLTITGAIEMNSLSAGSAIGQLHLPNVNVTRSINLPDGAANLSLASVGTRAGASITAGALIGSIYIGSVTNTKLTTTGGIRSLSVGSWAGGQINASWIGLLRSRDIFSPNLTLTGSKAPNNVALNSATIGSQLGSTAQTWTIAGNINHLSAAGYATGWKLTQSGKLGSLISTSNFAGSINAAMIGSISIHGQLDHARIASSSSIKSIVVTGSADDTSQFIATAFPRRASLNGSAVNPLVDFRFQVG